MESNTVSQTGEGWRQSMSIVTIHVDCPSFCTEIDSGNAPGPLDLVQITKLPSFENWPLNIIFKFTARKGAHCPKSFFNSRKHVLKRHFVKKQGTREEIGEVDTAKQDVDSTDSEVVTILQSSNPE